MFSKLFIVKPFLIIVLLLGLINTVKALPPIASQSVVTDTNLVLMGNSTNLFAKNLKLLNQAGPLTNVISSAVAPGNGNVAVTQSVNPTNGQVTYLIAPISTGITSWTTTNSAMYLTAVLWITSGNTAYPSGQAGLALGYFSDGNRIYSAQ